MNRAMSDSHGQRKQCRSCHHQHGAALIAALIFLLILTLQGVAGMHTARLETRITANSRLQSVALNNAEQALSHALADLQDALATGKDFAASGDHYFDSSPGSAASIDLMTPDWASITAAAVTAAANSRYFIVYAGCHAKPGSHGACLTPAARCPTAGACAHVYIISAHSDAGRGATRTVQSTLALDTGPAGAGIRQVNEVINGLRIWTDLMP